MKYSQKEKITSVVLISLLGSLFKVIFNFLKSLSRKFISKKNKEPLEIEFKLGKMVLKEKKSFVCHLIERRLFSAVKVVIE